MTDGLSRRLVWPSGLDRRSLLVGALAILAGHRGAQADATSEARPANWPPYLYQDLEHVALSVYITGDGARSQMASQVSVDANKVLNDRLRPLSIDSLQYSDLLAQNGAYLDPGAVLVIFCKVHLRSWPPEGSAANLVLGGVTLLLQRAGKHWQDEAERIELFASRGADTELQSAILTAVNAHLARAFVEPLSGLLKN